jgi:hypothetical protein
MELEVHLPQLDAVIAKLDQLREAIKNIDTVGACTGNDVELCVRTVLALDKKLDTLALTAAAPGSVSQPEIPVKPTKRARTAKAPPAATPTAADANGEEHCAEDEDALRARVEFEAKRTTRQFGIGGTRAAIGRVVDGALRVDDVPAARLTAVLSALQAL